MSDQPQEPIFFHDEHRAFLENRTADVLNFDTLRPHLYWIMTRVRVSNNTELHSRLFLFGLGGLLTIGYGIPVLIILVVSTIEDVISGNLPHSWETIEYVCYHGGGISTFLIGLPIGLRCLRFALDMISWSDQNIASLLKMIVQDGTLIQGNLQSTSYVHQMRFTIPYRFTTPSGAKLEREFYLTDDEYPKLQYLEVRKRFQPGTPVWVLYLNDKINVLL